MKRCIYCNMYTDHRSYFCEYCNKPTGRSQPKPETCETCLTYEECHSYGVEKNQALTCPAYEPK